MCMENGNVECKGCLSFDDKLYCAHKLNHRNCPCAECLVKGMCCSECAKFARCLTGRDTDNSKDAERIRIYHGR